MEAIEALDREVIIERAEAVRGWLGTLELSGRASGALERELGGIIADDPGDYIDGQRPLAGLTIDDFISELHSPGAGAVGRVQRVGSGVITELRAAIAAVTVDAPPAAPAAPRQRRRRAPVPATLIDVDLPLAEAPEEVVAPAPPPEAPRRRGRPKGSPNKPRVAPSQEQAPPVMAAALPISKPAPRSEPAPAATDAALAQLLRLWPTLHPHARRAMVLYASTLIAEG